MSFILRQKRTIKRRIQGVCGDDPYDFTIRLLVLPDSKTREIRGKLQEAQQIIRRFEQDPSTPLIMKDGGSVEDLDLQIARQVLDGWESDFLGEDGLPMPENDENKALLLDEQGMPARIAQEWAQATGESAKNSASSQSSGADQASK